MSNPTAPLSILFGSDDTITADIIALAITADLDNDEARADFANELYKRYETCAVWALREAAVVAGIKPRGRDRWAAIHALVKVARREAASLEREEQGERRAHRMFITDYADVYGIVEIDEDADPSGDAYRRGYSACWATSGAGPEPTDPDALRGWHDAMRERQSNYA